MHLGFISATNDSSHRGQTLEYSRDIEREHRRRTHVRLKLTSANSNWETASRGHGFLAGKYPACLILRAAIRITAARS
jgi:hypothetical protein